MSLAFLSSEISRGLMYVNDVIDVIAVPVAFFLKLLFSHQ